MEEKIKNAKIVQWTMLVLVILSLLIILSMMGVFEPNFRILIALLFLDALYLFIFHFSEFRLTKEAYSESQDDIVPRLTRKGRTVNPNTPKGKRIWFSRFIFPCVIMLMMLFFFFFI
ncbi:MAG: hypothetical protein ACI31W_00850 [Lactococcus sp.]